MVEEAKKGTLWSNDDFIHVKNLAEKAMNRLDSITDLSVFWGEKKDALQRLVVKKNVPFK